MIVQELPRSASKNQQQQPQQQQQEDDRGDLTWEQLEDINRGMTNLYKENRIDGVSSLAIQLGIACSSPSTCTAVL